MYFAMICICQIQGMETSRLYDLPQDAQALIVAAFTTRNDLDNAIKSIKTISLLDKKLNQTVKERYGDIGHLAGFTAFTAQLAKKFTTTTRDLIADRLLKAGIKNTYTGLGEQLLKAANHDDPQVRLGSLQLLITQGADVNYTATTYKYVKQIMGGPRIYGPTRTHSVLHNALVQACRQEDETSIAAVRLLLDNGANFSPNSGFVVSFFRVIEHQAKTKKASLS